MTTEIPNTNEKIAAILIFFALSKGSDAEKIIATVPAHAAANLKVTTKYIIHGYANEHN
jgi:hypothetical protein